MKETGITILKRNPCKKQAGICGMDISKSLTRSNSSNIYITSGNCFLRDLKKGMSLIQ